MFHFNLLLANDKNEIINIKNIDKNFILKKYLKWI